MQAFKSGEVDWNLGVSFVGCVTSAFSQKSFPEAYVPVSCEEYA